MARVLTLLAAGIVAALPVGASAQSATMRAEFTTAFDGAKTLIIDGRPWDCKGNACVTHGVDARPAVACRKLSRKVGQPVSRFAAREATLEAGDLATCNQDHK